MITGQSSLIYGSPFPVGISGTITMNSAAIWGGYSFIATESEITGLYLSVNSMTGTMGNIKLTFALQSVDVNGKPSGIDLASTEIIGGWVNSRLNAVPVSWTGLTIGARYWVVVKNTSAAPATDYPLITHSITGINENFANPQTGIGKLQTADSGATWTTGAAATAIICKFASGRLNVSPRDVTSSSDSATKMYGGRKAGVSFRTPQNAFISVSSATLLARGSGTLTTGQLSCELWINGSLAAISPLTIPHGIFTSAGSAITSWPFENVIIAPNSLVYVVNSYSAGDASNFLYNNNRAGVQGNDPILKAAKPCGGTMSKIYYDGSTWTTTDTEYYACVLLCNPVTPFLPAPLNRRQFNSMR